MLTNVGILITNVVKYWRRISLSVYSVNYIGDVYRCLPELMPLDVRLVTSY